MSAALTSVTPHPSEIALVRAAAGGCAESFETLARAYQVPLMRFLCKRMGRVEDAEDVFQETFVAVFNNLHRYDERWAFSTWLFTIARRKAVSFARRKSVRLVDVGPMELVQAASSDALNDAMRKEEGENLWDVARRTLSEDQFDVLWMFYAEQLSLNEVACVMDKSALSVRVSLHRARQKLKSVLSKAPAQEN